MAEISPSAFFNIWIFFTEKEEKNERKNTHTKRRKKRKDNFSTFECCSLKRKKRMKEMILIVPLRKQALLNDYTCSYKVDNNTTVLKISMMI